MLGAPVPQDDAPQFTVAVRPARDEVVVAPSGELDLVTAEVVERELTALRAVGFADVVVDLRGLTFIDSSGLRLLLTEARRAQEAGCRLRLIDGPEACRRLFELTGTREAFEFVERPPL